MGAKMRILELDAKRQMERKLKEAMYSFLIQRKVVVPYLLIRVRRDHLMEDSLNQLTGKEYELKKKLRIEFLGEPGIDAGGLTKEWFLLLVREVFSVHYGMFSFEEETNYFWFSPSSLEASDQFYLVGIVPPELSSEVCRLLVWPFTTPPSSTFNFLSRATRSCWACPLAWTIWPCFALHLISHYIDWDRRWYADCARC
jgi:hypothetical protein